MTEHDAPPAAEHEGPSHLEEAEHEASTFFHELKDRLIHWPSMSRPLKLITGLAIAQILAAAALIVMGAVQGIRGHLPVVSLYVTDGQLVSTIAPVLVATIVFVSMAWGYLLAGVAHAHPAIHVAGLTLFTVLTFTGWDSLNIEGGTLWITIVLVAAIWVVGGVTWFMHRRARGLDPQRSGSGPATTLAFLVTALLVGGLYLNAYLTYRAEGAQLLFTGSLALQLGSLSTLLIPLLVIAGADFAELAELVGNRVGAFGHARAGPRVVFGLAVLVALAVAGYQAYRFRHAVGTIATDVGVGVVAFAVVALLLWMGRVRTRARLAHVPQGTVALVAVLSFGLLYLLIFVPAQSGLSAAAAAERKHPTVSYGPYAFTGTPRFHLDKPSSWQTSDVTAGSSSRVSILLDGLAQADPALFGVAAYAAPVTPTQAIDGYLLDQSATGLWKGQPAYLDGGHQEGHLHVYDVHSVPVFGTSLYHARLWTETEGGYTWFLSGTTPASLWNFNGPIFDRMAASFGPGPAVPESAAPASADAAASTRLSDLERPETVTLGALLLLAIIALAMTRLAIGRRFASRITTAAMFITLVAVLDIAAVPNYVIDVVTNTPGHTLVPFHIEGIQTLVALLSLIWLTWCAFRRGVEGMIRPITRLLSLNIGLQIISWLFDLYTQTSGVGTFSIAQAVILILAFLVDIALSGEGTTNRDGRLFSRSARVHLYFGYILMTVAVILYFTTLRYQATGNPAPSQFESDGWAQAGLIQLGVPLLITIFLIGVMRRPSSPVAAAATGAEAP